MRLVKHDDRVPAQLVVLQHLSKQRAICGRQQWQRRYKRDLRDALTFWVGTRKFKKTTCSCETRAAAHVSRCIPTK